MVHTNGIITRPGGEVDPSKIDSEKFISETLGGMSGPVPVDIDEVYVKGKWGSRVAIADSFRSDKGRVFLAGDSGKLFWIVKRNANLIVNSTSTVTCRWTWIKHWHW